MELKATEPVQFLFRGTGEMTGRVRDFPWFKTPLGSIEQWPLSLQSSLSICLNSNFPIALYWGKDLVLIYNDAWSSIPGHKHPWSLGKPAREVWPDIWNVIEPQFDKAFKGEPGGSTDALLPMQRHGYTEECYFDFTFTPVFGQNGNVDGIFNAVIETTYRVINERRTAFLQRFSNALVSAQSIDDVYRIAISEISTNPKDIPFSFIYSVRGNGEAAIMGETESPDLKPGSNWPVEAMGTQGQAVYLPDITTYLREVPKGPWQEVPTQGLIVPLKGNGGGMSGFIVFGISSRRALDAEYEAFLESVGSSISTAINTISALEQERKRAQALAEIDRAKTVFFSNISHEFRTPLTLMLGTLDGILQKPQIEIGNENKAALETTHRNALRLLRLVNNLLDFSRIEAGREKAFFQRVDIAMFTKELAANFASLVESAGLSYHIQIHPVHDAVFVDKLMWEKIVLNIISNAFKYTLKGTITVSLSQEKNNVHFKVEDTGVGIPQEEIPKMFQRFHRVQNIGRTYEGTGIGLSLVHELVKLHGGNIFIESEVGIGTAFTISIPIGKDHLPHDRISPNSVNLDFNLAESFIEEASSLLENQPARSADNKDLPGTHSGKILIVDDNRDMRGYIRDLLQPRFHVVTAKDGKDALDKITGDCPDLVVSDIMMPVMDGVQLTKAVKANPDTKNLPVILLSARAGEEARVEGLETGADDYLTKPFSAKELIARITSQLNLSKSRKEVEHNLRNVILQSPMATVLLRGPSFIIEIVNNSGLEIWGRTLEQVINKPIAMALPEVAKQGFEKLLQQVYNTGQPFIGNETPVELVRFGKPTKVFLNFIYSPFRDTANNVIGIIAVGIDVSEQVQSRKLVEEAKSNLDNAIELGELGTWHIDLKTGRITYSARVAEWWGLAETGATLEDLLNCLHPDDRERVRNAVQRAIDETGKYDVEYRLIHPVTKQQRYIEANGMVSYDQNGGPVRLSGIVRDVTIQKSANQELERQVWLRTKQLEAANIDLKRSNNELMQFAYVASHDLQEPLRKIQTFSDMIRHNLSDANYVSAYVDKIDTSAARLSALIKDLLLYSRVTGSVDQFEHVDLNEILQDVKNDFELLIEQKQALITANALPTIKGNKFQFHQLFSNLIGNSLKFSAEQPLLEITYKIERGAEIKSGKVHNKAIDYHAFAFNDNGIGFDQIYADQIFGLFNRLHNREDYSGTGIGLTLCKKIVESHNGVITARSSKGQGASFRIYIPV